MKNKKECLFGLLGFFYVNSELEDCKLEVVLNRRIRCLGKGHPDTLNICNSLAFLYEMVGKTTKAEIELVYAVQKRYWAKAI